MHPVGAHSPECSFSLSHRREGKKEKTWCPNHPQYEWFQIPQLTYISFQCYDVVVSFYRWENWGQRIKYLGWGKIPASQRGRTGSQTICSKMFLFPVYVWRYEQIRGGITYISTFCVRHCKKKYKSHHFTPKFSCNKYNKIQLHLRACTVLQDLAPTYFSAFICSLSPSPMLF